MYRDILVSQFVNKILKDINHLLFRLCSFTGYVYEEMINYLGNIDDKVYDNLEKNVIIKHYNDKMRKKVDINFEYDEDIDDYYIEFDDYDDEFWE